MVIDGTVWPTGLLRDSDAFNSQGFITNAIYGFYNMLVKVLEEEKPAYLVVTFDKGKRFFVTKSMRTTKRPGKTRKSCASSFLC